MFGRFHLFNWFVRRWVAFFILFNLSNLTLILDRNYRILDSFRVFLIAIISEAILVLFFILKKHLISFLSIGIESLWVKRLVAIWRKNSNSVRQANTVSSQGRVGLGAQSVG